VALFQTRFIAIGVQYVAATAASALDRSAAGHDTPACALGRHAVAPVAFAVDPGPHASSSKIPKPPPGMTAEASESADFHLVAGSQSVDDTVKYGANDDVGFLLWQLNGLTNFFSQISPGYLAHPRCITKKSNTVSLGPRTPVVVPSKFTSHGQRLANSGARVQLRHVPRPGTGFLVSASRGISTLEAAACFCVISFFSPSSGPPGGPVRLASSVVVLLPPPPPEQVNRTFSPENTRKPLILNCRLGQPILIVRFLPQAGVPTTLRK
jgi:hypothetical protein